MAHITQPATDTRARSKGVFVTFEGVDGAGKSTQCALVCAALEQAGREVVRLREPGGTRVGERVRSLLLDPSVTVDPVCELLLYESARAQLVNEVIRPSLARGAAVVSDRFFDSTVAYQGYARELGIEMVETANRLACGTLEPDRTLVLDLDPADALCRATADHPADRIELEGASFQRQVRAGFAELAARNPQRVRVVDALGDVDTVWKRVRAALADLLDLPEAMPAIKDGAHERP